MKGIETLTMNRYEATEKWREVIAAEKRVRDLATRKQLAGLRKVYRQLKRGSKILDLFLTLEKLPMNTDGEPAIAIAPLGSKTGFFQKENDGGRGYGVFTGSSSDLSGIRNKNVEFARRVVLPRHIWAAWPRGSQPWDIPRRTLSAPAPTVPPKFLPDANAGYFIAWEVEHWKPEPPADPLLLMRITNNLFAVEAQWDLTPIERAFIRGGLV